MCALRMFFASKDPEISEAAAMLAESSGSAGEAALSEFCDRARARGAQLIERWDVREAAALISLFPSIAPSYAGRALAASPVDTSAGDDYEWVVERAPSVRSSPGM